MDAAAIQLYFDGGVVPTNVTFEVDQEVIISPDASLVEGDYEVHGLACDPDAEGPLPLRIGPPAPLPKQLGTVSVIASGQKIGDTCGGKQQRAFVDLALSLAPDVATHAANMRFFGTLDGKGVGRASAYGTLEVSRQSGFLADPPVTRIEVACTSGWGGPTIEPGRHRVGLRAHVAGSSYNDDLIAETDAEFVCAPFDAGTDAPSDGANLPVDGGATRIGDGGCSCALGGAPPAGPVVVVAALLARLLAGRATRRSTRAVVRPGR